VRNRIFKIEATYIEKVENTEKREYKTKVIDKKMCQYKENIKTRKLISVDNQTVPLFRGTVENNIYRSEKLLRLWDSPNTEVVIDIDGDYFSAILDIVRKGHNFFCLDEEDKSSVVRKFKLRNKNLEKDDIFNKLIREYFTDSEVFAQIVVDFTLNYSSVPKDLSDLVEDITYDKNLSHLDKHMMKTKEEYVKMTDIKNDKGIFLDYNKEMLIKFKVPVRTRMIGLKPFTADQSAFAPTTGSYYPKLYVSYNGVDWDYIAQMPSNYGSANDDYVTLFNLGGYKSFKYIKVNTDSSSQWSLSYIKLDYKDK